MRVTFGKEDVAPDGANAQWFEVYRNGRYEGKVFANDEKHVKYKMYFGLTDLKIKPGKWTVSGA